MTCYVVCMDFLARFLWALGSITMMLKYSNTLGLSLYYTTTQDCWYNKKTNDISLCILNRRHFLLLFSFWNKSLFWKRKKSLEKWENIRVPIFLLFFTFFYYVNDKRFKRTTYDASYEVRSLLPFSLKGKEFQAAVTLYTQIVVVQWIRGVKK